MINFFKRRFIYATRYSFAGLKMAWKSEESFRVEVIACCFLIPLALGIGKDATDKILLISSLLFVLVVEILNTGLEKTIDRISTDSHPGSKMVKDMGSAAVLIALLQAILTWTLILFL